MIGLIIVTHAQLAQAFIDALEQIAGPQKNIRAICIHPQDDIDLHRVNILNAVEEVDQGKGVILLTDLFGGTASNLAMAALSVKSVEVIAGVNLPMLVKLARLPENVTLKDAALLAQEAGRKYINMATSLLEAKVEEPVLKN